MRGARGTTDSRMEMIYAASARTNERVDKFVKLILFAAGVPLCRGNNW